MKPRWRPGKRQDTTCPQWILDGVKAIREQATNRTEQLPNTAPLSKGNLNGVICTCKPCRLAEHGKGEL